VVVNGSRAHVNSLSPSSDLRVVQISTDPERLATRLAQRGRDSDRAVADRLARNATFSGMSADCVIANDGELQVAGQRLADYLTGSARPAEAACSRIAR
jgi:ribose 1,5-bisphosphokinase